MADIPLFNAPLDPSLEQMNTLITQINAAIAQAGVNPNPTFTTLHVTGISSLDNGTITTNGTGTLTAGHFVGNGSGLTGINGFTPDGNGNFFAENPPVTPASGSNNVIIGSSAGSASATADGNTGMGFAAFQAVTSGANNTCLGPSCLAVLTTGSSNQCIGVNSANTLATGSSNIIIGANADVSNAASSDEIVIGLNAIGAGDHTAQIGGVQTTDIFLGAPTTSVLHAGKITNDGTNSWVLGAFNPADPHAQAGSVTVVINGVTVTLLTA